MHPTILVVIGDLDVGGTEHHLLRVLPALARQGFSPLVYTLTERLSLAPRFRAAGVEVIAPTMASAPPAVPRRSRDPALMLSAVKLWRLIRTRRPDVIHLFLPAAYLVGGAAALLAGHKTVVMSRRNLNRYQRKRPALAWLEQRLHRRITAALGNSRAVVRELAAEGVPRERLGLIYNGVDLDAFVGLPPAREIRARLGIAPTALVLTTSANLIPYKGHADLLDALAQVAGQMPARLGSPLRRPGRRCRAGAQGPRPRVGLRGTGAMAGATRRCPRAPHRQRPRHPGLPRGRLLQ